MTTNNPTVTLEMQTALLELTAAAKRMGASPQKQSALQSVLAPWAEGLREIGQGVAPFLTLVGCGGGVGMGLDLMNITTGAVNYGLGAGMVAGGLTVGARVVMDQLLGEVLEFLQGREKAQAPQVQSVPDNVDFVPDKGLLVYRADGSYITLLPDMPRHRVLRMAKITAGEFLGTSITTKHFSKNFLGRVWGESLSQAKEKLEAIGHIKNIGNRTFVFTNAGERWLEGVISER